MKHKQQNKQRLVLLRLPNPANSQVTVSYDVSSPSSAYLMITNVTMGSSNNYIIDTTTSQTIVNLSNYSQGVYTLTLICNGSIINSKN